MLKNRRWLLVANLVLIAILAVTACGTPAPATAPPETPEEVPPTATPEAAAPVVKEGGKFVIAMSAEPDNLDPHVTPYAMSHNVMMLIFDRLVEEDPVTHEFVPWLAKSWEVSDDGREWTFHLRDDVTFHDGTPFNAEAVCYSYDRIVDPETRSGNAASLLSDLYQGCEANDDYTAILSFSDAPASFLGAASQAFLGIVSPTAAEKWGLEEFGTHPVGSGPFIFVKWDKGDQIVLQKNPDYNWGHSLWKHQGPAYLDEIVFKYVTEPATRVAVLETGEVDALGWDPVISEFNRLATDPRFQTFRAIGTGLPKSMLINAQYPPTDDIRVRQAVEFAINREEIVETVMYGVPPVAYGPVSASMMCFDESLVENYPYPYDPERAAALLSEAGWEDTDGDGIRDKNGQPLTLITYITADAEEFFQAIQGQLLEAGMDMELNVLEMSVWIDESSSCEANFTWLGYASGDPQLMQRIFGSENIGAFNWSCWSNQEFDTIVQEADSELDGDKRCELFRQAQWLVMDNAVTVPLYERDVSVIAKKEVHDIAFDKVGFYYWLYDTWME
jgi:peptide/nickel transport system substrate-binding protein